MLTETIEGFRLSPQQEHLWLLQQVDKSSAYRTQCAVLIEGNLDTKTLTAALQDIVQRHEILRTTFDCVPGMTIPVQVINNNNLIESENYNLINLNYQEQAAKIEAIFHELSQLSFNFEQGPLLHTCLVTLSPEKHMLFVSLPALCADIATLGNFMRELGRSYAVCLQGEQLSDEPLQYADFSEWQNELLEAEKAEIGREYWRKQDFSELQSLKLPFEDKASEKKEFKPQFITTTIDADLKGKIEAIAQKYDISAAIFLLACWSVLLWRLTQQSDIIVGTAFDGRKYQELQEALGLFAKYLPLPSHLSENFRFAQILQQVNESERDFSEWQECFSWELIANQDANSAKPYCPVCFDFEEDSGQYTDGNVSFSIKKQYACIERFKIKLSCVRSDDALIAEFHYDSHLFGAEDIHRLAEQFYKLVESASKNPEAAIGELEILSDHALQQLLVEFNQTFADYPKDKCIHQLFEEQVSRTPDKIAVVFENQELTYSELNARANQLANYLLQLGVKPEVPVGICVERSREMAIGILGILKAGGAYVPLDPSYPTERLAFMLADSQVPVLLTQKQLVKGLPENKASVICLDADWTTIAQHSEINPVSKVTPENLTYIIYTSGSTGKPKGVLVTHRNLVHSTSARISYYQEPVTGFLLLSSFAFDSSVAGIFWTLCQGGTLILPPEGVQRQPLNIIELIAQHRVSHLLSLPSLYTLLLEQSKPKQLISLRSAIVAGETCAGELVERHLQLLPETSLFNEYGPTEATVWSSVYKCQTHHRRTQIPIGRPIANTQIYLLDSQLNPVPIGVVGEVYISGDGIARGYLNQPELTAEKFIPNPFLNSDKFPVLSLEFKESLYKTGDLARYLPDGNIEFLGRSDHQVKIRGFRIELEEIEAVLRQNSAVQEVIVLAREDRPGDQRLVAYIVLSPVTQISKNEAKNLPNDLRIFLRERLPDYMVPSAFVVLDSFPLLSNGKVNRRELPAPESFRPKLEAEYVAPRSSVERTIAAIWQEVLHLEKVGIHDNFFDLGGHSLLVVEVQSKLREVFHKNVPGVLEMFQYPTISSLALFLVQKQSEEPTLEPSYDRAEIRRQSIEQQRQFRQNHRGASN